MFVASGAYDRLRGSGRKEFFSDRLDPVLAEARDLGISTAEIIAHINTTETE